MMVTRLFVPTYVPPWRPILRYKKAASSEKPREQQQDHDDQNYDYKYWYEPTPHVLTSLARDVSLSNERQYEHDQKDYHQNDDYYGESPIYPPSPRSLSTRCPASRNIYPLRPPRKRKGYEEAAPLSGRRRQKPCSGAPYIMPPMPPPGIAGISSSGSATMTSVVTMRLPMEAAFCKAERETIVGSVTPAAMRSSY